MPESHTRRRNFLRTGLASLVACVFAKKSNAAPTLEDPNLIKRHMRQGNPPTQPLDTMLLFERGDDNNGRAMTHEVLSLIHEEKGENSYPWTLYTSLDTHHLNGDACVHCARLHKHNAGWSTGLHSEVFNHARGVALGANIEMSSDFTGPETTEVIGVNIQAVGGSRPMQHGIQIHDSGNHFDTGINLKGTFKTAGIAMHGIAIALDENGEITVRYRGGKIEFLNGKKCIGHIDVNGEDHAL
jgi:hypothetical protein